MSEIQRLNNMLKVATDEWTIKHIKRLLAEAINTAQELKEVNDWYYSTKKIKVHTVPKDEDKYLTWENWKVVEKRYSELTQQEIEKEVERWAEQRENSYLQIN